MFKTFNGYQHPYKTINDVKIDVKLIPLIKQIWRRNIITYECCQGGCYGPLEEYMYLREPTMNYIQNNKLYEYAYLIIHKNALLKIRDLLPEKINITKTSNGRLDPRWRKVVLEDEPEDYDEKFREYVKNIPPDEDLLYLWWKVDY